MIKKKGKRWQVRRKAEEIIIRKKILISIKKRGWGGGLLRRLKIYSPVWK